MPPPSLAAQEHVPRCGAWSRRRQAPCRHFAMRGRNRCFLHGGRNIHGAGFGNSSALKHGRTTAAAIAAKRKAAAAGKAARAQVRQEIEASEAALRAAAVLAAAAAGKRKRRTRVKTSPEGETS
jgi:hypothetical protein